MQLLYRGQYYKRYAKIFPHLKGEKVTELCFGDIIIADYCKNNKIEWTGYDVNAPFIIRAKKNKFYAVEADILATEKFEKADVCVMIGSLYHFHQSLEKVVTKMFDCASTIVLSEPIKNLTQNKGIIGKFAKGQSDINGQVQNFRFNEQTLMQALKELSLKLNFKIQVIEKFNKDIIIKLYK